MDCLQELELTKMLQYGNLWKKIEIPEEAFIAGKSVHNTRIEHLLHDVYQSASASYVSVFYELENDGALNVENIADLFSLYYVFIPITPLI